MTNAFDGGLQERLKQAEMAEREMQRLQPLASEAPHLRLQKAKSQREEERQRTKVQALDQAKNSIQAAAKRQNQVPELLGTAARTVIELYTLLKEVDSYRRKAMESLAVADRVDYDIELEEVEEHERSLDRDARGLAYALAARHGETRIKQLVEELDPGFTLLRGCNLDEPLYRDVANFVVRHAVPKDAPPSSVLSQPEAPKMIQSAPEPQRDPVAASEE